jgi:hypothetical protein
MHCDLPCMKTGKKKCVAACPAELLRSYRTLWHAALMMLIKLQQHNFQQLGMARFMAVEQLSYLAELAPVLCCCISLSSIHFSASMHF